MRLRFWRTPPPIEVDMTTGDEATAFRRHVESRWPQVNRQRRLHDDAGAHAMSILHENHFAQKAQHALGGRT